MKDFRILKICFLVLTLYLLIEEIIDFVIIKPTLTSVTQTNLTPANFPDILICPEKAFDLDYIHKLGYKYSFYYGSGYILGESYKGWLGNQTALNVTKVADDVPNLNSLDKCPEMKGRFKFEGRYKTITLAMALTRVLYHSGKCCRVIKPKEADNYTISYIYTAIKYSRFTNFTNGFSIIFSEQKSALIVQQPKFISDGMQLKFSIDHPGLIKYRIKVLEEIHLEDDPNFPCRNYKYNGEYNQCLEDEYTRQSLEILNCTPPWMTDNHDVWCKLNVNGTAKTKEKTWFLLGNNKH